MATRMIKLGTVALAITGCFLISSCNSSNSSKSEQANVPVNKKDTVLIENMKFTPDNITVKKGDTLVFINKDIVKHDVTQKDKAWQSPALGMDESWEHVADHSDEYYCSLHVVMTGKFTVE